MRLALTLSGLFPLEAAGTDRVVLLPDGWRRLFGFPARSVAGPLNALERLACEVRIGVRAIPKSVRRVMVQSRIDSPLLRERDRDFLWHAFQLPVFEQVRGCDGELIAWECDAHSGLHLNAGSQVKVPVDLAARSVHGLCACGRRSPRLIVTPTAL